MKVWLDSIGLLGPGLADWPAGRGILQAPEQWFADEVRLPAPAGLPSAERRRVSQSVKVAMAVARQATDASDLDPATLAAVFCSSGGDGPNCHQLCEALAEPQPQLSPTRFTNSVHNAPSGYWSIAVGSHACCTSIAGHDESFATGLLEATTLASTEQRPVLLVVYDVPYPFPLSLARPISAPFGIALMLRPSVAPGALAALQVSLPASQQLRTAAGTIPAPSALRDARLEALRQDVPSARGLVLLDAVARGGTHELLFTLPAERRLAVAVQAPA